MLALVDTHIATRLGKITLANVSMKHYDYEPDREKGTTQYPHTWFSRLYFKEDLSRARPNHEQFTPNEETETLIFTPVQAMGGPTELTGPVSWTRKPYPTPIQVVYEIGASATNKTHWNQLEPMVIQAFPVGYQPNINSQYPLFIKTSPHNLDERDKPLFSISFLMWVHDVWIDRFEEYTSPSIVEPLLEWGTFNEGDTH